MNIKNVNSTNLNKLSRNQQGGKLDKTDSIKSPADSAFATKLNASRNSAKVDTIVLSQRPVTVSKTLSQVKDRILSEINEDTDVAAIEKLKAQLNNGQYTINPLDIAKSMLTESNT